METHEKIDLCSKLFIHWSIKAREDEDMTKHDEEVAEIFTSKIILKKFEVFGINIVLPDDLLLILYLCVEGNPGQFQIVLKELLKNIAEKNGPIPAGYVITPDDFVRAFPLHFPVMSIPEINKKYEALWEDQKYETPLGIRNNRCDTVEWWQEVMAK